MICREQSGRGERFQAIFHLWERGCGELSETLRKVLIICVATGMKAFLTRHINELQSVPITVLNETPPLLFDGLFHRRARHTLRLLCLF